MVLLFLFNYDYVYAYVTCCVGQIGSLAKISAFF